MKKLLLIALVFGASFSAMAQEAEQQDPTLKHSVTTNSFWSNWFLQANFQWNAMYSNEERGMGITGNPFSSKRGAPGFSIAIGKWFTPGIGLRTKFQGVWGKTVYTDDASLNSNKQWILDENVLFNLHNLIGGYKQDRFWNCIPFFGAGFGRSCTWNKYGVDLNIGILNTFRICDKWKANFEIGYDYFADDFDGVQSVSGQPKSTVATGISRPFKGHDHHLYFEAGITYELGKATWNKTPDVDAIKNLSQAQIDALNAQLSDANAENTRLKNELANQPKVQEAPAPQTIRELVGTPLTIFFNLNKSTVANKKELFNLGMLAEYAKEHNCSLNVTGYADSKTGNADYNRALSEKRAYTIANKLIKMGVPADKINVKAGGGVNELSPVSYNRRVLVEVAK